ncbi:MAG: hypothetical protein ACJAYE_001021 [Candidatus Azotimanducaceae bacterium]|jgi:hypothetical protein
MKSRVVWFVVLSLAGLLAQFPLLAERKPIILDTGPGLHQTLLAVDQRLYVFTVDDQGQRSFQVGQSENGYLLAPQRHPLSDRVIFVDSIKTPKGALAVVIHQGEARDLDTNRLILEFDSIYNVPVVDAVPRYRVFRDINGDGLDDFLIPSFSGYQVAVQQEDGVFSKPISLDAAPIMEMSYNNHPWYQAKNLFVADMNFDQRSDLILWDKDHFIVYAQLNSGEFSAEPFTIPSSVPLDYDSVDGMSVRMSNEDQSNKTVTVVHGIDDYDGDGVPDLMTMQVKSEGVFRKKTTFALHPGQATEQQHVGFGAQPTSSIESSGIQYEMEARDLDGDQDLDLIVSSVELGVGKIIAALLTSSIKIELGFYVMENGRYPDKPDATRAITATFSLSTGEFWLPAVLIHDATGDGRDDLFLQENDEQMNLFIGEAGHDVFAKRAEPIKMPMPKDPDLIELEQINADGMVDFVIRIPPPLGDAVGLHRAVLLISSDQ